MRTIPRPAMPYRPPAALLWTVDDTSLLPVVRRGVVVVRPTPCQRLGFLDRDACVERATRLAAALNRIYDGSAV